MAEWIAPDQLFDGQVLQSGMAMLVKDGRIIEIGPSKDSARAIKGMITPGFVDLQVNGGGGVMLNNIPTVAGIATMLQAHRRFGTTSLMPTVITDHPNVLARVAGAAIAAKDLPGMTGLHIEGPHIAPARRGTHAERFIRPMDTNTIAIVAGLRQAGLPVMITLAPEAANPDQIKALVGLGATVSLGHTDATAAQMQAAMQAGATCVTHLFNAMSPMQSREPGAVGAAINSDCYAGLICDGHHVDDSMIRLAVRARPCADRMFLVSDAMATVGGPDQFDLYGQTIAVQDGRLINADGALAGAHTTLAAGLQRIAGFGGVNPETALRMVTAVPAKCIGVPALGQLLGQRTQDVLVLDGDLSVSGDLAAIAG